MLRIGHVSVTIRGYLQLPTDAYNDLSKYIVTCFCVLSAYYYLDRHHVLKSLVTPRCDRNKTIASNQYMYTCLPRATGIRFSVKPGVLKRGTATSWYVPLLFSLLTNRPDEISNS